MELFYSAEINGGYCSLSQEESAHCVRVLRHKAGDIINVIDGEGSLLKCRIVAVGKNSTELEILEREEGFGSHDYHLTMAVCPTKNIDRYEWFLEKATEIGVDAVVPVIGEHSERKIIKPDRCEKILLSATKQSLKATLPKLHECCSVGEFIKSCSCISAPDGKKPLKLIAYCGEATKSSVQEALQEYLGESVSKDVPANLLEDASAETSELLPQIVVLIGPEGDFSQQEVDLATEHGFIPVHLGKSRLRTETAAVVACCQVYSVLAIFE